MSGLDIREPGDYDLLLTQTARDAADAIRGAGHRSIAVMPGLKNPWPEGAFYGFDAI